MIRVALKKMLASRLSLGVAEACILARSGGLRILNFHRVVPDGLPDDDYRAGQFADYPSVTEFETLLKYLSNNYSVISVLDYLQSLKNGKNKGLYVGLTFDDGYMDNYENAWPLLKKYNMPATFFVTTGAMEGQRLWFQRLLVFLGIADMDAVEVSWGAKRYELTNKLVAIKTIAAELKKHEACRREEMIDELFNRYPLVAEQTEERDAEQMMTWREVSEMNKSNLVEIGSHTVSHPILADLRGEGLEYELNHSYEEVRKYIQKDNIMLSYPSGSFDSRVEQAARDAGYLAGITGVPGINRGKGMDLFRVRRNYLHSVDQRMIDMTIYGVYDVVNRIRGEVQVGG